MPIALTRRGSAFALAAIGVWASWFAIGLRDLWFLAALLATMVVLGLAWLLVLPPLARFSAAISRTNPTPTVGERLGCSATVRHRLPMTLPLQAEWQSAVEKRLVPLTLAPGRGAVCHASWVPHARGQQQARLTALIVLDPLGLARRRVRIEAAAEVLVLPAQLPALARRLDQLAPHSERAAFAGERSRTHDSGPPSGAVRGYRSGDALRQIHWKQSARQGELLVNLHDGDEDPGRSLLLVTAAESYRSEAEFETAVAAAATLAVHWLRQGRPVRLGLGGEPPMLCRSEGEALRRLAMVGLDGERIGAEVRGAEARRAETRSIERPPRLDAVDAVIVGSVNEHLRRALSGTPGGLLLSARDAAASTGSAPGNWREVIVQPLPSQEFDSPLVVSTDG